MSKKTIIIVAVVGVIVAVVGGILGYNFASKANKNNNSSLSVKSAEDLSKLIDTIYARVSIEMPSLETQEIDTTDENMVSMFTGLNSAENIEYLVVSEPMMSSQAYSLVLVKAKDGADVDAMAKTMNENINESKWLCVTAEKIYTTTSGNVICLVMTNTETADNVFDSFKTIAGSVGQVYERTAEEPELPPEMIITE